jgi:HK97 family phage major capsid protein
VSDLTILKTVTTEDLKAASLEQLRRGEDHWSRQSRSLHQAMVTRQQQLAADGVDLTEEDAFEDFRVNHALPADGATQFAQSIREEISRRAERQAQIAGWGSGKSESSKLGDPMKLREIVNLPQFAGIRAKMVERMFSSEEWRGWYSGYQGAAKSGDAQLGAYIQRQPPGAVEVLTRSEFRSLLDFRAATITGGGATSAAPFIVNDMQPGFYDYSRKERGVAEMVGRAETDSDTVEYVSKTAVAAQATPTAEDTASTEATVTFTNATVAVREIPVHIPVTLRAMADEPNIRSIVEDDLVGDVLDELEDQIASGSGAGQNMMGIYNTSGIQTQAVGADTRLDALHKAITKVRTGTGVKGAKVDYIGLNPNDWQDIRLQKDTNGNYIMGPAGMVGEKTVWGVPARDLECFTDGTPIVGEFGRSAKFWVRQGVTVTVGLNADDFTKRRVTLLATLRGAFAVTRPAAFCTVTGF